MLAYLVQIDGYDPVAGAAVTLRAASHDDDRICHLNGQAWLPTIAELPTLPKDNFDGDFGAAIRAPSSSLRLTTEPWPHFGRYALADARIRLWSGEIGAAWVAWKQRFEGRVTAQPRLAAGSAPISFAVDDRWLDKPLLEPYAGTGGAEGPEALKGTVKSLMLGAPRYAGGVLVDAVNTVFQLSAYGAIEGVEDAMDGLARFGAPAADYASYDALIAATIPAGSWATAKAVGMTRHGAPPLGEVSYMVLGDCAGVDGWARLPGDVIRRIALISGGAGRIDDVAMDALNLSRPWNVSIAITEQTTAREVIQRLAASVNAVAGVDWLGKLYVTPVALKSPVLTINADGSTLPPVQSVEQAEVGAPWWRLSIKTENTWAVHAPADVQQTEPAEPGATVGATPEQVDQLAQLDASVAQAKIDIAAAETLIQQIQGSVTVDLAELNSSITALDGEVSGLQTSLSGVQGTISAIQGSVSDLNADLATANGLITAIQGSVGQIGTEVDSLQSTVSTQGASISANATAITGLQGNLATLTTEVRAGSNRNLLPNGGPEASLRGWSGSGWSVNSNNSDGAYFLGSSATPGTYVLTSDPIPMEAGATLTLAYETSSTGTGGYADLQCYSADGNTILDGTQHGGSAGAGWGDRASRAVTVTTPANTSYVRVRLVVVITTASDRGRIRRIKLEKGSVWTPYSLDASVAQTFTALSTAETSLASLSSTVSTQGGAITILQTSMTSANGSISTLQTNVTSLSGSVSTLQSSMTTAQGQISSLQSTVSTQGASIASNATAITGLQGNLATLTTRVAASGFNLLPNGGLENGMVQVASAPNWGRTSAPDWGPYAYTVTNGTQVFMFASVPAQVGAQYTFAVDPLAFGASAVYCDMLFLDAAGNVILDSGQNNLVGHYNFDTTTARRAAIATTATAPTGSVAIAARVVAQVVGGQTAGFRMAKLEAGAQWSPYSAGAAIVQAFTALSTLDTSYASLNTTVSSLSGSVGVLQTSMTNAQGSISTLQSTVSTQGGLITSNATAISTLSGTVSTLSSTVSAQGSSITSLQTAQSTAAGRIATLETRVSAGGGNLLPNGGLENGFSGVANAAAYGFVNSSRWGPIASTTATGTQVFEFAPVRVSPNATYTLACDPVATGTGSTAYCDMIFRDSSGAVLLDGPQNQLVGSFDFDITTGRRGQIAISAQAPAGAYDVICRFVGNAQGGGTVGFRKMKLEAGSLWSPYSSEASLVQSWSAISTATGSIASLSSTVSTQGGSISSLQSSMTTVQGSVSSLQSTVSAQGASISTLQTATSALEGNVAQLTTRVSASGANLLPNGGLENGFTTGVSPGAFAFSNGPDWGPVALCYTNGLQIFYFAPVLNPQANGVYTFAVDPLAFGTSDVYCNIQCINGSGGVLLDGQAHGIAPPFNFDATDNRRGQIACTITVPSGTAQLVCRVYGTVRNGQPIGFRRAKLEYGPTWSRYSAEATIVQQFSTLSTLSTQYASLSSTVSTQGVTVSQVQTAITTINGQVADLFGQYVLNVDVNGRVAGMKLANNGSATSLRFNSDLVSFESSSPNSGAVEILHPSAGKTVIRMTNENGVVVSRWGWLGN